MALKVNLGEGDGGDGGGSDDVSDTGELRMSSSDNPLAGLDDLDDRIKEVVTCYQECFVEVGGLGRAKDVKHEIKLLSDHTSIRSRPYRLTWEEEDYLGKEIKTMLDDGLIRRSAGAWTAPIFFVKKKGGELRMVIDYRKLNDMTIKDAYPLPLIDDVLGSLGGATVFSTLDAASGFWQVGMDEGSVEKTGFTTKFGTFEFMVMPFGLTNAPSTFQRLMTSVLGSCIGVFAMVFIDDIIIYSANMDDHKTHLDQVFKRCKEAGLQLKLKKCSFGKSEVEYLGHTVSGAGLAPNSNNINKTP
jgi:hypothetical protein